MEYITRHCPRCNGELHIPVEMTTCICMYCGEAFNIQDDKQAGAADEAAKAVEAEYQKALGNVALLVKEYDFYLHQFTADRYPGSFEQYSEIGRSVLDPMEKYAALSEEKLLKVVEEAANAIMAAIDQDIHKPIKAWNNLDKARGVDQHRFFLTAFLVPMILNLNYHISEPLADAIRNAWGQKYPKFQFEKSGYERILDGFKRKGFCFITTAVCETLNKDDDCYELAAFRNFRDNYMLQTEERRALVEEYYRIAPAIVAAINMNMDAMDTYLGIWVKYLQPCLQAIEGNKLEICESHYCKMVNDLKRGYYFI